MRLAGFEVGSKTAPFLIAGPCVIESEALVMGTAERHQDTPLDEASRALCDGPNA